MSKVIVHADKATAAKAVAATIRDLIIAKAKAGQNAVLGLATGSTPLPLYAELVRLHREEALSFRNVVSFNLDEYEGLPGDHPQSYRYFMEQNLFRFIDIRRENTHVPAGISADASRTCADYEAAILAAGGIDLQVLGIGRTGHIGFNEPSSSLRSRTRVKTLTRQTFADNRVGAKRIKCTACNGTGDKQGMKEGGMPSSVIKSKQRYGDMSDKDFAELHQSKSDDDLMAMAWRHGYGKGSLHYVNKRKRGLARVEESRLYYNVIGTRDKDLKESFGMQKDQRGWFLEATAGRKRILEAHKAFGTPTII